MRSHRPLVLGLYQRAFFCVTELQKFRGPEQFVFYAATCAVGLLHALLMKLSEQPPGRWKSGLNYYSLLESFLRPWSGRHFPVSQMGHRAWVPGTGFMLGSVHLGEKGKELEAQFQLWAGSSWKGPAIGEYTFS